jgi:hypothetical protein
MSQLTIDSVAEHMPKPAIFTGPEAKVMLKPVTVICPECDKHIDGIIETCEGFPFAAYNAYCHTCEQWVMESEWDEVEEGFGE